MLRISYDVNTGAERSAVIVVTVDGFPVSQEIIITQAPRPVLRIDHTNFSVHATSGKITLPVKTIEGAPWTAERKRPMDLWIKSLKNLRNIHSMLEISYGANAGAERSAVIVVTVDGFPVSQEITLTQAAPTISSITPATLEVSSGVGNSIVALNYAGPLWQAKNDARLWCRVYHTDRTDRARIYYDENTGSQRQATITFTTGNASANLIVTQLAPLVKIISNQSIKTSTKSGTATVNIQATAPWRIEESIDWLNVTPNSGAEGDFTLTVTYDEATRARSSSFNIVAGAEDATVSAKVFIRQRPSITIRSAGGNLSLDLTEVNLTFPDPNTTLWIAASNVKWLNVLTSWGPVSTKNLQVRVKENFNTKARKGVLHIFVAPPNSGVFLQDIDVLQEPEPFTFQTLNTNAHLKGRTLKVGSMADKVTVYVRSSVGRNWTIATSASDIPWIDELSKTGNSILEIKYRAHTTSQEDRSADILLAQTLSDGSIRQVKLQITQTHRPVARLNIIPGTGAIITTDQSITHSASSSFASYTIVTKPATAPWEVTSEDVPWASFSMASGQTFSYSLLDNYDRADRSAMVTVRSGVTKIKLRIVQKRASISIPQDRHTIHIGPEPSRQVVAGANKIIKDGPDDMIWYAKLSNTPHPFLGDWTHPQMDKQGFRKKYIEILFPGASHYLSPESSSTLSRLGDSKGISFISYANPTNLERETQVHIYLNSLNRLKRIPALTINVIQQGMIRIKDTWRKAISDAYKENRVHEFYTSLTLGKVAVAPVRTDPLSPFFSTHLRPGDARIELDHNMTTVPVHIESGNTPINANQKPNRWKATEDSDWISLSRTDPTDPELRITAMENTGNLRNATITITHMIHRKKFTASIQIYQRSRIIVTYPNDLVIVINSIVVDANKGEFFLRLFESGGVEISEDSNWLTVKKLNDNLSDSSHLLLTKQANLGAKRQAEITLTLGAASLVFTVIQEGR